MAGVTSLLMSKLEQVGLGDNHIPIFKGVINMQATTELHIETFQQHLQYMQDEVDRYVVELPDSTSRWVPLDFIRYIYKGDNTFRFRLARFLKGLTRTHYRVEDEDVVFNLEKGPLGNNFLSWDMTITLFLHEGKPMESEKGKAPAKEVPLVETDQSEQDQKEETLSDQAEASMALVLLQMGDTEAEGQAEDLDRMLDPEEVIDSMPELDVTGLYPIIVDGEEFIFLDDICKSLGLREDEALSIISNLAALTGEGETSQPRVEVDFIDHDLTKALEFKAYDGDKTMEVNAAAAIVKLLETRDWYESIPDSAFHPHKRFHLSDSLDHGSIDISKPNLKEKDKDIVVSLIEVHHILPIR